MNIRGWFKPLVVAFAVIGLSLPALAAVYEKAGLLVPPSTHVKIGDNSHLRFGDGAVRGDPGAYDITVRWDGTDLDILAAADDSVIKLGNGTNSFDAWVYGNTASDYLLWDASANNLSTQGDAYIALNDFRHGVTAITGDKTVAATESGTVFYVTSGSGVTFTLPSPAAGLTFEMCNVVNQNLTVSASPDLLVAFNNASASTVAYSTLGEKIGGCFKVVGTTGYYLVQAVGAGANTVTVVD